MDWTRLVNLARDLHVTISLGASLSFLRTTFPTPIPEEVVEELKAVRVDHAERRYFETLVHRNSGWREVLAYNLAMEFEVQDGSVLFPVLSVRNEWGTKVLWTTDTGTEWHGRKGPPGRYRVIAWIPPNFLAAGAMTVSAAVHSFLPRTEHFCEVDAVGFQAVDTLGAGTARGYFTGHIGAAIRPKLEWTVEYEAGVTGTNPARMSAPRSDRAV